ncbi:MAG: RluA family pseudouridine synthase, partial [Planctomycetales bacterium]|nr:RluA family pseudouridine synthase [Planctomycetales bacterium]
LTLTDAPRTAPPAAQDVAVRYVDRWLVIAEKPSGMLTLRRGEERNWPARRRYEQPTLDEAVALKIARHAGRRSQRGGRLRPPRLLPVHRLDRDTSGIVLLARDPAAQTALMKQFAQRTACRIYLAIVPGNLRDQSLRSRLVRDRGDGIRGSTLDETAGKPAVTHVRILRRFAKHCELQCELETGRTNQIRIQLAEAGHPVCGDLKYNDTQSIRPADSTPCPRLALHATSLRFSHPETGEAMEFHCEWPEDVQPFLRLIASP